MSHRASMLLGGHDPKLQTGAYSVAVNTGLNELQPPESGREGGWWETGWRWDVKDDLHSRDLEEDLKRLGAATSSLLSTVCFFFFVVDISTLSPEAKRGLCWHECRHRENMSRFQKHRSGCGHSSRRDSGHTVDFQPNKQIQEKRT